MNGRTAAVVAAVMAAIWAAAAGMSVAGQLEPPAAPSDPASAMYTLQDIYNLATTGAQATKRAGAFTEPTAGPTTPTMATANEIYAAVSNVATKARVAKTGAEHLTGYTFVAGEDGHASMRKGLAWPNPRFTDNNNGTVTDNLTGLIWLKNANFKAGTRTWANALTDCATLKHGEGGLTDGSVEGDWRLPNVQELQSLIDYGRYNPALCNTAGTGQWTSGDPFTGVQSSFYWSSTTRAAGTTLAWYVGLYDGYATVDYKSVAAYVWPVRGGQ